MNENIPILSFTSHAKRLPLVDEVFRSHVANADAAGIRVCLSLQEDSVPAMTPYQRSLVDSGKIELLTIGNDHGSNTKWTLCRAKYPGATMIVVDDDVIYAPEALRTLLAWHDRFPDAFLCRVARKLSWTGGSLVPFVFSTRGPNPPNPLLTTQGPFPIALVAGRFMPEHWGGCLYPPGFPDPSLATEASARCFHDDDAFTGLAIVRAGLPALLVPRGDSVCVRRWTGHDTPIWQASLSAENKLKYGGPGGRTRQALAGLEQDLRTVGPVSAEDLAETWSRFDHKFVLTAGNVSRVESVRKELARVGLADAQELRDDGTELPGFPNRPLLAHRRAARLAAELGGSVLVMEDDVRFLRNLRTLRDLAVSLPDDFGEARFSWGYAKEISSKTARTSLRRFPDDPAIWWRRVPDAVLAFCVARSERSNLAFLDVASREIASGGTVVRNADLLWPSMRGWHGVGPLYVCGPRGAVQSFRDADVNSAFSGSDASFQYGDVSESGMLPCDYADWEPSK